MNLDCRGGRSQYGDSRLLDIIPEKNGFGKPKKTLISSLRANKSMQRPAEGSGWDVRRLSRNRTKRIRRALLREEVVKNLVQRDLKIVIKAAPEMRDDRVSSGFAHIRKHPVGIGCVNIMQCGFALLVMINFNDPVGRAYEPIFLHAALGVGFFFVRAVIPRRAGERLSVQARGLFRFLFDLQ